MEAKSSLLGYMLIIDVYVLRRCQASVDIIMMTGL